MRAVKGMLKSMSVLASAVAMTLATPLRALQDAPVKVDVQTTETHTVWYTNPVWLAIGGLAVLLIIVLAVMAARNKGDTTVVR